jgi:hypothetical protein
MSTPQHDADEFYKYPGNSYDSFRKAPYTVERTGVVVTTTVDGGPPRMTRLDNVPEARAEFAEATCEPNGPGAPQADDRIVIIYGPGQDVVFAVTESIVRANPGGWTEFEVHGWREPLVLALGQYRIVSRPVA